MNVHFNMLHVSMQKGEKQGDSLCHLENKLCNVQLHTLIGLSDLNASLHFKNHSAPANFVFGATCKKSLWHIAQWASKHAPVT